MDIIVSTQSKRAEILAYVKPRLNFQSYSWVNNVFNELNKKIMFEKDDVLACKVYPLYDNLILFFEEFCDDVTPGAILYTIYSCLVECGFTALGNSVEKLTEFTDEVDENDWQNVTLETVMAFDMRTNILIGDRYLNPNSEKSFIWACGLATLYQLPYHQKLRESW